MRGENYVQCVYIAQGGVVLHVSEEVIMATLTITPIRLKYSDNSPVVVEPEDHDKLVMYVKEAILACRIYDEYKEVFENQLDHLKNELGKWIQDHNTKIDKAFLTLRDARFFFLVVMNQQTYDRQFEDDLTDLELAIACDPSCSKIALDVQALPLCEEENYISFCNTQWMFSYEKLNA